MSEKQGGAIKDHAVSEAEDYAKATEIAIRKYELSKHKKRPTIRDYIPRIFDDFIELHGDRGYADDKAVLCGIARFNGLPVTIIGQVKGHNTNENIESNFGMAKPEGYRKALRQMKLAEKFSRPIITFVDTPGAHPGVESEERGQGEAIARNLIEMSRLKTPVLTVITGEGNSGGALGIAQSNCVLMLENAVYAIISAKGFISILWKDSNNRKDPEKEKEAAARLKMTATDLVKFGVIDGIIPEPPEGAHKDHDVTAAAIKTAIEVNLAPLLKMSPEEVYIHRYNKFRNMGIFFES